MIGRVIVFARVNHIITQLRASSLVGKLLSASRVVTRFNIVMTLQGRGV